MRKHFLVLLTGLIMFSYSTAQKKKYNDASTGDDTKEIKKTVPSPPGNNTVALYNEGIRLKDQKKYSDALASFKKALVVKPEYREALYQAGWCCNELEKYTDAINYLKKARSLWPEEPKVYLDLGYANQQAGIKEEARANYSKCLSLKNDYALAYQYLGNLYYGESDYAKALENYEFYVRYESSITSATFYYKMGFCQNDLKKYEGAIGSFKKAVSLKTGYLDAYNELAYSNTKLGNSEEALKNYNEALRIDPKSTVAYNGIGDVYKDEKKDLDEALKNFFKSLDINPQNKKTNYLIGWCYNEKQHYNDAVPYLKKALEIDKEYIVAITELGYCDYALQNYNDALKQFNRANSINKTELSSYYAGLCYVGLKKKEDALRTYEDLKSMNSSYTEKLKKKIDAL